LVEFIRLMMALLLLRIPRAFALLFVLTVRANETRALLRFLAKNSFVALSVHSKNRRVLLLLRMPRAAALLFVLIVVLRATSALLVCRASVLPVPALIALLLLRFENRIALLRFLAKKSFVALSVRSKNRSVLLLLRSPNRSALLFVRI